MSCLAQCRRRPIGIGLHLFVHAGDRHAVKARQARREHPATTIYVGLMRPRPPMKAHAPEMLAAGPSAGAEGPMSTECKAAVETIVEEFAADRSRLMDIVEAVQQRFGYVSD